LSGSTQVSDEALAQRVRESLVDIIDPCSAAHARPMGLVEMGLIESVRADGDELTVRLRLTSPSCMMVGYLTSEIRRAAMGVPGVSTVRVKCDTGLDWDEEMIDREAVVRRHRRLGILDQPRRRPVSAPRP
jgi:metal-sulfur cluster biosynthetic enzyme